ncbi:LppU/SCO3897 family protein [Paractinoplanes rishiriensis]|uniref:Uncharacterized protein n=1 Tax=Paractinoplanes rishiriensis TaxID=1050105 RepID=A0A919K4J8_9ACTN|nr:hypothetical protein [Actinoplanes rishiriensis]GIE96491.1 hypothetical protein Ari01nite_39560 [Actinoplanes rishiriensis]
MSQNGPYSGPPWSQGSSDEPYAEPADPWGEHGSTVPDPAWGAHPPSVPQQPVSYHSAPGWANPSPPAPPKRNTPMIALVVTLGVLVCVGLGATAWLLKERSDRGEPQTLSSAAPSNKPGAAPVGSEDARFNVKVGDCVVNEGTDEQPEMRAIACTTGSFEVLKRVAGRTTGEKDAESKCSDVQGYTKWYFYDSPFDELDFVLCLKEHKQL